MISFEKFAKLTIESVNRMTGEIPEIKTIEKTDGSYTGLVIPKEGVGMPVANLNGIYAMYIAKVKGGEDEEETLTAAIKEVCAIVTMQPMQLTEFTPPKSYDDIKGKTYVAFLPSGAEKSKYPHKELLDLQAVVFVKLDDFGPFYRRFAVPQGMLDDFGVDFDTVFNDALENSAKIFPPEIKYLADAIFETTGAKVPRTDVLVMTNPDHENGSWMMANPALLNAACDVLKTDEVFIIPSSIDELIVVKPDGDPRRANAIQKGLRLANLSEAKENVLSDNLYKFKRGGDVEFAIQPMAC